MPIRPIREQARIVARAHGELQRQAGATPSRICAAVSNRDIIGRTIAGGGDGWTT
jgi:hypothetical protein